MDLFSDFQPEKWTDKGTPPAKLKDLDGYAPMNIFRGNKEETNGEKLFNYYMNSDATGLPCTAYLYGAYRDAFKGIGHCTMKVVVKNNVHLITGIIVEDEWVEIKPEYFDSLDVSAPPPADEGKETRLSLIIGLAGDLQHDKWKKMDGEPPKNKTGLGYTYFNVVRQNAEDDGTRIYYLTNANGVPVQGFLTGADRDPLRDVMNCYLKMNKENNKEMIKGIIVEKDWVEMIC